MNRFPHIAFLTAFLLLFSVMAMPDRAEGQILFGNDTGVAHVPFSVEGGHLLIDVMLNGKGPYEFYFDTGATNVMTPEVAQELGLELKSAGYVAGFGHDRVKARTTSVSSYSLAGLNVYDAPFAVVTLPHGLVDRGSRPKLAGLIGATMLKHYVVRIDFKQQMMTFTPVDSFTYDGVGTAMDIDLKLGFTSMGTMQELAQGSLDFEGQPVSADFDTGSNGFVVVYPKTALADTLTERPGDRVRYVAPGGIGGTAEVDMMRAGAVELAGYTIKSPIVAVMTAPDIGFKTGRTEVINAGVGLLRFFDVTIDFPHARLYLTPRSKTAFDMKRFPMWGTGLQLTKEVQDRFRILRIVPGSPAEQAGITAHDQIFEVDGKPASQLALFDVSSNKPGMTQTLVLGTEDNRRTVSVKAKILLP